MSRTNNSYFQTITKTIGTNKLWIKLSLPFSPQEKTIIFFDDISVLFTRAQYKTDEWFMRFNFLSRSVEDKRLE